MPVIRPVEDDHVVASGGGAGHPQGQVVGFAARVAEVEAVEARRQRSGEALGVGEDVLVQVAGVGVETRRLGRDGGDDARMAVPDVGDVVVAVEEATAARVDEPHVVAAHEVQRCLVREAEVAAEVSPPGREQRARPRRQLAGPASRRGAWRGEGVASDLGAATGAASRPASRSRTGTGRPRSIGGSPAIVTLMQSRAAIRSNSASTSWA